MQNLFDFDDAPALREGPDLRNMNRIDFPRFIEQLSSAEVVVCASRDDGFVVLPDGEELMRAAKDKAALNYLVVQVANDSTS
jgi:hypothetical protein